MLKNVSCARTRTKRGITKRHGNIPPSLVAMHKFDRNIGQYELTFIDRRPAAAGITRGILLHMEKAGNIATRSVVSRRKEPSEGGNELRARVAVLEGEGRRGENANRVKNVYNISRGNNVAYGISSCEIFSRISWRHATQGTPSLFAARMSLY